MRWICVITACLFFAPVGFGADPQQAMLQMLGDDLIWKKIKLIGLSPKSAGYMEPSTEAGATTWQYRSLSMNKLVRLTRPGGKASKPRGLYLADGQQLAGTFVGVGSDGNIRWQTHALDTSGAETQRVLTIDLDDVLMFVVSGVPTAPKSIGKVQTQDRITLTNGDQSEGLIDSMNKDGIQLDVAGNMVSVRWSSVKTVWVSNTFKAKAGTWLTLRSGSKIRVEKIVVESGRLRGSTSLGKIDLDLADLKQLDFNEHHELMMLGDLKAQVSGSDVFGAALAPTFSGETAKLHAPLMVRFELPAGATRFSGRAAIEDSPKARQWTDLTLRVADGKGVRFAHRFNAKTPTAAILTELRDRVLVLSLDDGVNGPIMDRLDLTHAYILVKKTAK